MAEIIPAILVESRDAFERRLRLVENDAKTVQVDILDGTLFPYTNWFNAEDVGAMRTEVAYELHLMVENPLPIIKEWKKHVPNLKRAIVHTEMKRPLGAVVGEIKDVLKLEAGVAINPETPISEIEDTLHNVDMLLVMGVHPGASGQEFEGDYIIDKIAQARAHYKDLAIGIDGGVREELLERLIKAGANRLCGASLIYGAENPTEELQRLNKAYSTPT